MNGFFSLSESSLRGTKESPERSGDVRRVPIAVEIFFGSRRFTRDGRVSGVRRGRNESGSITVRCALEESKWEVWLVFLAAWSLKGTSLRTRV